MDNAVPIPPRIFTFPAQPAGESSRRNWFQELLDHPDCQGDAVKIQEAYESFRLTGLNHALETAKADPETAFVPDAALVRYLELQNSAKSVAERNGRTYTPHQEIPEVSESDMNCFCIWARPDQQTLAIIQELQSDFSRLVGPVLHMIPTEDMHLSLLEISHRHDLPFLRKVHSFIGDNLLEKLLSVPATFTHQPPRLIKPMLLFDKSGIALSFVPAVAEYTYHHLRTQLHSMLLETGMAIDTCYTAPIAHITIARFVEGSLFTPYRWWPRTKKEKVDAWTDLIWGENRRLQCKYWGGADAAPFEWVVGKDSGLEAQLGYIKFGRPRRMALMVGPASPQDEEVNDEVHETKLV